MRASFVAIVALNMLMSLALWGGFNATIMFTGVTTMPNYAVPGVPTTRPEATRTGVVVVVLAVAILLVWLGPLTSADDPRMHVVVETELLGDGVGEGTSVRSRGVDVGTVEGVTAAGNGIVTLDLALDRDRLFGIDDSLRVDYAPSNLFGISGGVELVSGPGGAELRDGTTIDLTGPPRWRRLRRTMSALLRQFSSITGQALTPQLTSALTQLSAGIDSFAPLLRAGIAVASVVEETQWMPASELAGGIWPRCYGGWATSRPPPLGLRRAAIQPTAA